MLLATPENMEKCKDIAGVVALDLETEETFSADPGDYFMMASTFPVKRGSAGKGRELVLAVRVCQWVDPLSGEPLSAQIAAKVFSDITSLDDALGQGRN